MKIRMINESRSKPILTFVPGHCYIANKSNEERGKDYIIICGGMFEYNILFDPNGSVNVVSIKYIDEHFIPSRCITESIKIDIRY